MNVVRVKWAQLNLNRFPVTTALLDRQVRCYHVGRRDDGAARPKPKDRFAYPEGVLPYEEDYILDGSLPEYPEIDPETRLLPDAHKKKRQRMLDWHQRIRERGNPEGKTLEMNMPRHYGWRTMMLNEDVFEYDSLSMYQFITQSHLIDDGGMPEVYSSPELMKKAKYFAEKLQGPLMEVIDFELDEQNRRSVTRDPLKVTAKEVDTKKSLNLVSQINRVILSVLGGEVDHLSRCSVDVSPKIEAFWFIGGQQPSENLRSQRRNAQKHKDLWKYKGGVDDPVERNMQYSGSALLQIRCDQPIPNFVESNDPVCLRPPDASSVFPYTLANYRVFKKFYYASIYPGVWTTDPLNCSHIAFHPRHHLLHPSVQQSEYWKGDAENALSSQAIVASFGRMLAQALYFGFDQFSDLNYPFSTQTIITDGLKWSLAAYQLNTLHLSEFHLTKNTKQNICWKLPTMDLVETSADKTRTINTETLETILKFYLNKPAPIPVENPTPYLNPSMFMSKWEDEIQRESIFYNYRDMVSQRWYLMEGILKHQYPEIYEWEWIYKIRHPQRPMEARRRFFEFPWDFPGRNPYDKAYQLLNPRTVRKRMRFLMAEVAARKEKERMEEAKRVENVKFGVTDETAFKFK